MLLNLKFFISLYFVFQLSVSSISTEHPSSSNTINSKSNVNDNVHQPTNDDSPSPTGLGLIKSIPKSNNNNNKKEESVDEPMGDLKAGLVDIVTKFIEGANPEELQLQIEKLVMVPTVGFLSSIIEVIFKLADNPKIKDAVTTKVVDSITSNLEMINIMIGTLDVFAKKNSFLVDAIKKSFGPKLSENKALISFVGKISMDIYNKKPEVGKKTVLKLLEANKNHDFLADSFVVSLKSINANSSPKTI